MSHRWDVYCIDCDKDLSLYARDGGDCRDPETVLELLRNRDVLFLQPRVGEERTDGGTTIKFGYYHFDADWFRIHKGHRLAPRNDYGLIRNQCWEYVPCPTCKHEKPCQRPAGHEGPHALELGEADKKKLAV